MFSFIIVYFVIYDEKLPIFLCFINNSAAQDGAVDTVYISSQLFTVAGCRVNVYAKNICIRDLCLLSYILLKPQVDYWKNNKDNKNVP